jgi:probable HAF family extracellular repeat protein
MSVASELAWHVGAAFKRLWAEPRERRNLSRGCPRRAPRLEPLEDRRLCSYTITNLGSLGGTVTIPLSLNNHGEVVGWSATPNEGPAHAFFFRRGKLTDLGTLGGPDSVAMSINDRGDIVGLSFVAPGSMRIDAFLDHRGHLTDLGPQSQPFAMAGNVSINAGGTISGLSGTGLDAWILHRGAYIDVGSLAGRGSVARDINDMGEVVGASATAVHAAASSSSAPTVTFHAFVDNRGAMTDLGTLGGANSEANFINNHGAVVGYSDTADGAIHTFLDRRGKMTDLGTLGGRDSNAWAINNEGDVVGTAQTSASASHGYIDQHGRMIDLNSLIPSDSGIVITDAQDVNDRGEIVAEGYATTSPSILLALLLKPTWPAR